MTVKKRESAVDRFERSFRDKGVSRQTVSLFRKIVYDHYYRAERRMPWRNTRDPYRILVSEIMLQQTRVERVLDKYRLFIKVFPDFPSLARADLVDVLRVWQGLGYNRRAIALKKIAGAVMGEYDGRLPVDMEELRRLPGIGRYTAAAIYTFVRNRPSLFIETNIRRVFIHFFFRDREQVRDEEIVPLLERTLDAGKPREWYYALMDYGASLTKEVRNPNLRSAHYQRQTPFRGSERQIRGMVLKMLVQGPAMTAAEIRKNIPVPSAPLARILGDLLAEGFIRKQGRTFVIS